MENNVENEICNNCKKEIPQSNYVMHSVHCARKITLCKICKEPVPKADFADHEKLCQKPIEPKQLPPLSNFEKSSYYQHRKTIEDKKAESRRERYLQKMEKMVDSGYSLKSTSSNYNTTRNTDQSSARDKPNYKKNSSNLYRESSNKSRFSDKNDSTSELDESREVTKKTIQASVREENAAAQLPLPPLIRRAEPSKPSGMLACRYCDLELPKLDLEEHENYCGSRTDKCLECGELVMFKDKQIHMDSNHGFLKKRNGQRNEMWESTTERSGSTSDIRPRRNAGSRPFADFNYDPMPYLPSAYQAPGGGAKKKEGESYKEISRRLDCKTEYIRNILHDSAAITVPLRRSGTAPRNYFFNDLKGPTSPPPPPPSYRRRNPPTELVIPCEFCNVPVPHEELIQHETGCRPDLARLNPRRRPSLEDDYYTEPREDRQDDEELPCEFCGDMIPASRLYSHQFQCT